MTDNARTMIRKHWFPLLSTEAIKALAETHQRKRGAITSRLVKLGLLERDATSQFD